MPTYDYKCRKCEHIFETFHGMSEEPAVECPSCGGAMKRLIGGGLGIIFKGSGFYVTDNKTATKSSTAPAATGTDSSASKEKSPAASNKTVGKKEAVKSSAE